MGRRLRKLNLKGTTLSLKIRLGNHSIKQAQTTLENATDDERFFTPFLFDLLTSIWAPGTPVRLVGVGISNFDHPEQQLSLFEPAGPSVKNQQLLSATDAIKDKFGEAALSFGHELRNRSNNTGTTRK